MWWPPTIMVKIGVTITSMGNAVSGKIVMLEYAPVKCVAGCIDTPTCYRPYPKSTPNGCFGKKDAIFSWMRSCATIALMTKMRRLPEKKALIGSPIIVVNAEPSDVFLNKPSPTGNGRNPYLCRWWAAHHVGLESLVQVRININSGFSQFLRGCRWPFAREAPKAWIRMWNIYVTSTVILVTYSSHPFTLEPSPSRPWPSPSWTPPCLSSLGPRFI